RWYWRWSSCSPIECDNRLLRFGATGCGLGGRVLPYRNAFVPQQGLQLARLEHLAHDVAATDKLALHVKLRNCWPIGIGFDAAAQLLVLEHIKALIGNAQIIENLHELSRKAAHWKLRRTLHEQHDIVGLDLVINELFDSHCLVLPGGAQHWPSAGIPFGIYVAELACKAHRRRLVPRLLRRGRESPDRACRPSYEKVAVPCLAIRGASLQRQRVQFAAHFPFQRFVDDLVLLHARLATE